MDTELRQRVQVLLHEDRESPTGLEGKLRERVTKFLRNEKRRKDQRTGQIKRRSPMGPVTGGLETADLNPTAERE